jgi:hypothetical protein
MPEEGETPSSGTSIPEKIIRTLTSNADAIGHIDSRAVKALRRGQTFFGKSTNRLPGHRKVARIRTPALETRLEKCTWL